MLKIAHKWWYFHIYHKVQVLCSNCLPEYAFSVILDFYFCRETLTLFHLKHLRRCAIFSFVPLLLPCQVYVADSHVESSRLSEFPLPPVSPSLCVCVLQPERGRLWSIVHVLFYFFPIIICALETLTLKRLQVTRTEKNNLIACGDHFL